MLRSLPSVDELLLRPRVVQLCNSLERGYAVATVREVLAQVRREIISQQVKNESAISPTALEQRIVSTVEAELAPSLRPVINASGVILHTNLGRAPLIASAIEELRLSATHYSNLEYDLSAGARGKRDVHLSRLIERLTGAEAAIVVNNCAAAVLVTLAALARGGEVIVSRGELIEIGDGFRIPEIMEQSGAVLREVGTTNRTRISDYENAITEKTRLLLRVHPSNFTVTGFTEKPEVAELIALGERRALPVIEDLGSGCLSIFLPPEFTSRPRAQVSGPDSHWCCSAETSFSAARKPASSLAGRNWLPKSAATRCSAPCAWTSSPSPPWKPHCTPICAVPGAKFHRSA